MRPRWNGHAGYARTPGGALVRSATAESWIGGRDVYRLLTQLVPHLDGRVPLGRVTRHLDAGRATAVSTLVDHLVRIGAVDDLDSPGAPAEVSSPLDPLAVPTVWGSGQLHDAVVAEPGLPAAASGCPAVVTIHDVPDRRRDRRLRRRLAGRGLAWLPVRVDLNEVWMGPWSGAWPGCPTCLDLRRRAAHRFGHARERIARDVARRGLPNPLLRGSELARTVLDLVAAWDPRDVRAVVRIPLGGGPPEPSAVLPVPGCPSCGEPAPVAARLDLERDRAESLESITARLDRFLPNRRAGIVCAVVCRPDESLPEAPLARAWAPGQDLVRGRRRAEEWTLGSGDTPAEARTVAILEALERYAASRPRGHDLECASAGDLGAAALDPRSLILHADDQYRRPGFACVPFEPGAPRRWARAHSVRQCRELAVPADLVYYQVRTLPLAYNTSSGCAIGAGAAGAALRALLEVLERDAFLLAWYARRPLCRLDLASSRDPRIPRLAAALRAEGYECIALDVSLPDLRLPSVWAMAVGGGEAGLKTLSGACAHPVPELAVLGAIREVACRLRLMRQHYESQRRRSQRLTADPTLVRRPMDHALLYGSPRAFWRLEPLLGPRSPASLAEHFAPAFAVPPSRWLDALCSRLVALGFDVLFADVTPADVRELGLTVVRALVPGALPITFGHGRERLAGATRAPRDVDTLWPHPLA